MILKTEGADTAHRGDETVLGIRGADTTHREDEMVLGTKATIKAHGIRIIAIIARIGQDTIHHHKGTFTILGTKITMAGEQEVGTGMEMDIVQTETATTTTTIDRGKRLTRTTTMMERQKRLVN